MSLLNNMVCPFEKQEVSCKICEGTDGAMESMFCDQNDDRLLNKIFKCTDVKVKPVYGIISPICEFCRSRIEHFDDNFQPQCKEYVVEKVNTISVAPDDDPFNCLDPSDIVQDAALGLLECTVDIKEEDSVEGNVREVHLETIFQKEEIEIKPESGYLLTESPSKLGALDNAEEIKDERSECQTDEGSSVHSSNGEHDDQDSEETEPEKLYHTQRTKRTNHPKSDTTLGVLKMPTKCEICGKMVTYMKDHMRLHSGDKRYQCPHCERSFIQSNNLIYHVRKHTGEKPFACDKCDKSFICKSHLLSHSRSHANDQPYVCEFCSRRFNQACNLTKHLRIHSGEKPYKCGSCSKAFMNLSNMKAHEKRHRGERNFSCEVCSKSFYDSHHLERHLAIHNRSNEKQFKCNLCQKQLNTASGLKSHMTNHERLVEKVNCSTCDEEFANPRQLKRHLKNNCIFSDSSQFSCHVCLRNFKSIVRLEKHHQQAHSGGQSEKSPREVEKDSDTVQKSIDEASPVKSKATSRGAIIDPIAVRKQLEAGLTKPFRCDVCSKQFDQARYLKVHFQIHMPNSKSFECDKCPRSFTRKEQLVFHDRVHTGSRPFICEYCPEQFIRSSDLKRHQLASHADSSVRRKKQQQPPQDPLAGADVSTQLIELPPEVLPGSDQVLIKFEIKNI
ncbi:zinc finger protein 3 homolog [Topomyia yanbarensis]|uniref:zinc finger protein 3 homolog n=1 Tax=Topomyia yanbarensis TaxID=2498891 RepID=UPI00273B3E6D|nr:zinc finger protein 3 homolog [Topomyia yanbarensis]